MKILRSVVASCAVLALAAGQPTTSAAHVQLRENPPVPPRDSRPDKKGTAIIRGRVTSADSGRPLRRVQIRVSAAELTESRTVSTNSQGRYELRDLPAGR